MPSRRIMPKTGRMLGLPKKRIMPPRWGPGFAEIAARFLEKQGQQTAFEPAVLQYAARFKGAGMETVDAIVDAIARFKRRQLAMEELRHIYVKRTAADIIKSGFVAVSKKRNPEPFSNVMGCTDFNIVLCAILRAKGIPAKFVRALTNTYTHFYLDGKWFEVNQALALARIVNRRKKLKAAEPIKEIGTKRAREIEVMKRQGNCAEGLDAWDIGVKSFSDFNNYAH